MVEDVIVISGDFEKQQYFGLSTYNNFLVKVKGNYYVPMWLVDNIRNSLLKRIEKEKEYKKFTENILNGWDSFRKNTTKVIFVNDGDAFKLMNDLITLYILGFNEEEVKRIVNVPYAITNFRIIKSLFNVLFKGKSPKEILKTAINESNIDYFILLTNALFGHYSILYLPNERQEIRYLFERLDNHSNRIVDLSKKYNIHPYCTQLDNSILFPKAVHYCSIRPNEYAVYYYDYDNGKWIKLADTVKCDKFDENTLIDFANVGTILSVRNNTIELDSSLVGKLGLSKFKDGVYPCKFEIMKSVNRIYFVKKCSHHIKVYCLNCEMKLNKKGRFDYHCMNNSSKYKMVIFRT